MKPEHIANSPSAAAFDVGEWVGRRETFAAIAGRCSAAEIECLRRIRDTRLYRSHARNWNQFCNTHLRVSRRTVDAHIRLLDELGAGYFHLAQLVRVTPAEYRQIASRIGADGLAAGAESVPLIPENRDRIAAIVAEVRVKPKKAPPPKPDRFEAALAHCQAAADLLETLFSPPPFARQLVMVCVLNRVRDAAARLGILGPDAQARR